MHLPGLVGARVSGARWHGWRGEPQRCRATGSALQHQAETARRHGASRGASSRAAFGMTSSAYGAPRQGSHDYAGS